MVKTNKTEESNSILRKHWLDYKGKVDVISEGEVYRNVSFKISIKENNVARFEFNNGNSTFDFWRGLDYFYEDYILGYISSYDGGEIDEREILSC